MRPLTSSLLLVVACGLAGCTHRVACPVLAPAVTVTPPADCPPPRDYPFRNLVFEGGGVKGLAYGGALEVLADQGILEKVERVAGTSAGSITAMLVALRYTPEEIRTLLFGLDFKSFEDRGATGIFRLFRRYGYFAGDTYLELMRCLVGDKTGKRNATFRDLKNGGFLDLRVFSSDLNAGDVRELSYQTTPDLEVALAVRMSGSFPIFFASIPRDGDVFVDGGVVDNYPIDTFDSKSGLNPETLGFLLLDTSAPPARTEIRDLFGYSKALLGTILRAQIDGLEHDPANLERTVILDDLGTPTLDFDLTPQQKRALIDAGARCTCSYLSDWTGWQDAGRHPGEEHRGGRIPLRDASRCGSAFPTAGPTAAGPGGSR